MQKTNIIPPSLYSDSEDPARSVMYSRQRTWSEHTENEIQSNAGTLITALRPLSTPVLFAMFEEACTRRRRRQVIRKDKINEKNTRGKIIRTFKKHSLYY